VRAVSSDEFKELLRRELPSMEDKMSPWRPWTGLQQQIALQACKIVLEVKK